MKIEETSEARSSTGARVLSTRNTPANAGPKPMPQIALAKMHNAQRAKAILSDARDMLGGNGVVLDYHVARHLCDIEAILTYEGTGVVQALIVGRDITGLNAFVPAPPPARR